MPSSHSSDTFGIGSNPVAFAGNAEFDRTDVEDVYT